MGMQVRLVLHAASEPVARAAARAAFDEIARLDAVFSNYRHDSEIRALTAGSGAPQAVSDEMLTVLQRAQRLARLSGGAFDVTAAPLTELWRAAIARGELPDGEALADARSRVGYEMLRIDAAAGTVTVGDGMELDVGGIAKGFILDRALEVLRGEGLDRALVEAGGDIVVGSAPPASEGWRIEVPHVDCVVPLEDAAIATSGDRFQFVEIDGVRYAHVVDPRTGLGVSHGRTVTIIAPDGLTADGLATTLTVIREAETPGLLAAFPGARALPTPSDCS